MKRGDLVMVALSGDLGKPRPALIVQSDLYDDTGSVTILPVSGTLVDAPLVRLTVHPTQQNGLQKPSQIMVDKASTIKRAKVGPTFGHVGDETMLAVTRALAVFLGLA